MAINLHSTQQVAVFDGQNYEFWAARMQTTLKSKELWEVVSEGIPEPATTTLETPGPEQTKEATNLKAIKIKDTAALQIIQHTVADAIFDKILSATTAKEAWDLLEFSYQGNEKVKMVRLQSLRRDFENLKMKEGEKVKAYSDRIQAVANQMRALGGGRSNFDLVVKMLASMPRSYAPLSSLMEETKDIRTVTYAELLGSLEAHEKKFFPDDEEDNEGAFLAKFRGLKTEDCDRSISGQSSNKGKRWCGFCKRDNHNEDVCWIKSGKIRHDFNRNRDTRNCFNCGKAGHFARDCRSKRIEQAQANQEEDEEQEEEANYHMFTARLADQELFEENTWLIDSGCTNHMTSKEDMFINLNRNVKVPILIGNGAVLMSKGKGDVAIMTKEGKKVIQNVFLVPEITKNLLSVSQMIENGYEVIFKQGSCIIHDQAGRRIAEVQMIKNSFHLKLSVIEETSMLAQNAQSKKLQQKMVRVEDSNLKNQQSVKTCEDSKTNLKTHQVSKDGSETDVETEIKAEKYMIKRSGSEINKKWSSVSIKKNESVGSRTESKDQPKAWAIKENTNQKEKTSSENEKNHKIIKDETCKRDAVKTKETEKKNQELTYKGFGFREVKSTKKIESIKEPWHVLKVQSKEEKKKVFVSDQCNIIKIGDIQLDPVHLQVKRKSELIKTDENQKLNEEIIALEGAEKANSSKTYVNALENQIKREAEKSNSPMSYADAVKKASSSVTKKLCNVKLTGSNFKTLTWNQGSNQCNQEGVLSVIPLIAPVKGKEDQNQELKKKNRGK